MLLWYPDKPPPKKIKIFKIFFKFFKIFFKIFKIFFKFIKIYFFFFFQKKEKFKFFSVNTPPSPYTLIQIKIYVTVNYPALFMTVLIMHYVECCNGFCDWPNTKVRHETRQTDFTVVMLNEL